MDVYPLSRCPDEAIDAILHTLALFKAVYQFDPKQFQVLVNHSQLLDLGPGEAVLEEGQVDTWLYFLLKGGLAVYAGEPQLKRVNAITPGELFGDMAVLLHHFRSATVVADTRHRRSIVLRLDFAIFGELSDFSTVSLPVKLVFYKSMVHNLRWKIEVYRGQYPNHRFFSDHRKIKLYSGLPNGIEELVSLEDQARSLAELLTSWNLALTAEETR